MQFVKPLSSVTVHNWRWHGYFLALLLTALCGCATSRPAETVTRRPFNFQTDTFAFPNDLIWEYRFDENGKWVSKPRLPKPDYTHHCFVVARSARQFFEHARFDPQAPVSDASTYRRLIQKVLSTSPSHDVADSARVVIPGYADLRSFSQAQESLLKEQCGGAWHSYLQHGHWRLIMPFSRSHQEQMSQQLLEAIKQNHPPVAHLVRFPQLTINHAVVLFDAVETEHDIQFTAYDPNNPRKPVPLTFDRSTRTFQFPANDYFPGGRVDVYEVYLNWRY
jgi:hypothetical protein